MMAIAKRGSSSLLVIAVLLSMFGNSGTANQWTTATLSQARFMIASASLGNKAFFAGGAPSNSFGTVRVDIYNDAQDLWTTANLSQPRHAVAGASAGDKALFAGGLGYVIGTQTGLVDIYDSPKDSWATAGLSYARWGIASASTGFPNNKAFFGGGYGIEPSSVVDIYDADSNKWTTANLSLPRGDLAATASAGGDLVFFAGGSGPLGKFSDVVDIYNVQSNTWSTSQLSEPRSSLAAVATGTRVYFAGGYNNSVVNPKHRVSNTVDIYNLSNNTWSIANLSEPRAEISAAAAGGYVFFAGELNRNTCSCMTTHLHRRLGSSRTVL